MTTAENVWNCVNVLQHFAVCIHLCHPGQRQGASLCRQTMMTASKQQHRRLASSTAVLTEEGGAKKKKKGGRKLRNRKGQFCNCGRLRLVSQLKYEKHHRIFLLFCAPSVGSKSCCRSLERSYSMFAKQIRIFGHFVCENRTSHHLGMCPINLCLSVKQGIIY